MHIKCNEQNSSSGGMHIPNPWNLLRRMMTVLVSKILFGALTLSLWLYINSAFLRFHKASAESYRRTSPKRVCQPNTTNAKPMHI
jgi:hypothetical protein